MWFFLLTLACAKEIPPHLRVEAPSTESTSAPASLSSLVAHDPLLRRPKPRKAGDWQDVQGGQAIEIWAQTARRPNATPSDWSTVEASTRGTIGVPLSRGARLAAIEVTRGEWDEEIQQRIAAWIGLSGVEARPATSTPAEPLAWLPGHTPDEKFDAAEHLVRRMVMEGWFDGPKVDQTHAAEALNSDAHTLVADSPYGQLLLARNLGVMDAEAHTSGEQFFWEATGHALAWAAADKDIEQQYLQKQRADFRAQRNETPTAWNLARARELFILDASNQASSGLALVTIAAERLEGSCPDKPCSGLDVVASITRAGRWGSDAASGAAVWQVIALKRALDTLSVSLDKPSLYRRLPQIADALSGMNESPIELSFLRHRVPTPGMMLAISRMAGGTPTSDTEQAIDAVARRLQKACDHALATGVPPNLVQPIKRIWISANHTK